MYHICIYIYIHIYTYAHLKCPFHACLTLSGGDDMMKVNKHPFLVHEHTFLGRNARTWCAPLVGPLKNARTFTFARFAAHEAHVHRLIDRF